MSDSKEYVSRSDELGNIHISEEVLAAISAAAALEVDGVSSLAANLGSDIAELLGKKNLAKGVRIRMEEDRVVVHAWTQDPEIRAGVEEVTAKLRDKLLLCRRVAAERSPFVITQADVVLRMERPEEDEI